MHAEKVFDGDRQAGQWADGFTGSQSAIDIAGLVQDDFVIKVNVNVQILELGSSVQKRLGHFFGVKLTGRDTRYHFRRRQVCQLHGATQKSRSDG